MATSGVPRCTVCPSVTRIWVMTPGTSGYTFTFAPFAW